jgi:hypothetical protein
MFAWSLSVMSWPYMDALTDSNERSTSMIEHVMDCLTNKAKSWTELIQMIHTNIQESIPRWKALGIPSFLTLIVLQVNPLKVAYHTFATPGFRNFNRFYYYQLLLTFVWCCTFLKTTNAGLTFMGTKNSDRYMRENDKSKNDQCGLNFHSLNEICSGTTEIEQWIRENDISVNDSSRFHSMCIYVFKLFYFFLPDYLSKRL